MANQEKNLGPREPSERANQDALDREERQEPQEQARPEDAATRPVSPATHARRPLFRI